MAYRLAIGVVGIAVAATPVLAQEPGRELEFGGGWSRAAHGAGEVLVGPARRRRAVPDRRRRCADR